MAFNYKEQYGVIVICKDEKDAAGDFTNGSSLKV